MSLTQKNLRNKLRKAAFLPVCAGMFLFFGFTTDGGDAEYYLKIYRGIDTFTKVYKEIAVNYVDSLDPDEFMRAGVDGMLRTLDPYTVYIGEKENDEIDLITNGKYGGVGVTIGLRDGYVTVINLLEGFSASRQGVEIGDRIIEVEGKSTKGMSMEDIRQVVRGTPGTELKMKIEREGEKKLLDFVLMREEISVHNIAYAGYVANGIGYVRLERFSRTAGDDLRNTIRDLKTSGELKGIVLDLRDNPGGLLESAVEVVSQFVPESSLVVSTRGRKIDSERKYYSYETQTLKDVPAAILVNKLSASASEIVGGALQDLDRGVLVGTRTFGKGLVQTITRISDNASLKITTARYYTPSGRCIQEVDYWHRDGDGNVTTKPDSLRREFRTAHNRPVWEGGGILPDTVVTDTIRNMYLEELNRKSMLFQYANHYAIEKKMIPDTFVVSDMLIEDFEKFLKDKGFEYQDEGAVKLKELRAFAAGARYNQSFMDDIGKLEKELEAGKNEEIHRYQEDIRAALKTEILSRMKGDKARFESTFAADVQLQTAIHILENKKLYNKILALQKK